MSNDILYRKIRVKENLNLLFFSFKNFNFSPLEIIGAILYFLKYFKTFIFFNI